MVETSGVDSWFGFLIMLVSFVGTDSDITFGDLAKEIFCRNTLEVVPDWFCNWESEDRDLLS